MDEEYRKKLHQLLDQMLDEKQPVGTFSYMYNPDNDYNEPLQIKMFKLFLDERDFLPGA